MLNRSRIHIRGGVTRKRAKQRVVYPYYMVSWVFIGRNPVWYVAQASLLVMEYGCWGTFHFKGCWLLNKSPLRKLHWWAMDIPRYKSEMQLGTWTSG